MLSYVNNKFCSLEKAQISVNDRGYQFGDAVYEVIFCKNGNEIIPARGSSTIDPGDKLVMFVPVKSIKKVQELLSVRLDYF